MPPIYQPVERMSHLPGVGRPFTAGLPASVHHPRSAPAYEGILATRAQDVHRRQRHAMASSSGRALEVPEQRGGMQPSSARPWQFDLPTLAEMQEGGWVDKVRDWELFWARHKVWQNFTQYKARKNAKPRREHEEWWGLHDPVAVQKALNAVADKMEDLLTLGVPVPEHVPFDNFGNVHVDRRAFDIYGRKKLAHFALDKQVRSQLVGRAPKDNTEAPPPWESWNEWDFRAYVEKKRKAERQHADWVARQARVSVEGTLNVTPLTDSRLLTNYIRQTSTLPRRETHEEIMNLITGGGRHVAPEDVAMRVQDPLAAADWFQEGCHYVPELEEFLDAIGHYAASDADLIHARDEGPSTTLNEAFSDFEEAAYDGMAEQVLSSLGKEEGAPEGSASMDEAFDTNP